jgi:hypothetical protein
MSAPDMPEKVQLGSGRKKDTSLMLECFRGVTKHKEHWNKWMVNQCWIDTTMERHKLNESAAGPCCSEMVAQTHDDHTF